MLLAVKDRMSNVLIKSLVASTLVTKPAKHVYHMEGITCHCGSSSYLGIPLAISKDTFHCDNKAVVGIWEKHST